MIPKVKVESAELCRMVCGTNQFVGISHFFHLDTSRWNEPGRIHRSPLSTPYYYFKFKDTAKVAEIMIYLVQEHGINSCVSSPRENIHEAIKTTEKETGERFHWLCTPSHVRKTVKGFERDIFKQIEWCQEHDVSFCGPHRSFTDTKIDFDKGIIDGLPEVLSKVRDCDMIPLLSTHFHQSISIVEQQGYDIPLIIQPLNSMGFESNAPSPDDLASKIAESKVQVLNIKPMAAGRIRPRAGLVYCLERIKENDLLAVGFGDIKFAKEDAQIVEEFFARK